MRPDYAQAYRELYSNHWWWRARENNLVRQLRRFLPDRVEHLLDVGCGDRLSFSVFSRFAKEIRGIESDKSLLSEDSINDRRLFCGNFSAEQPFKGPFNVITAMDVIEHISDDKAALTQMHDLLQTGGLLFIHVPARMSLWTSHDEFNHHYRRYEAHQIQSLVEQAGFEVLQLRGYFWFTVPIKWVQSKLEMLGSRASANDSKLPSIPTGFLNTMIKLWCGFESLLGDLVPTRFGSSLFLVARRRK